MAPREEFEEGRGVLYAFLIREELNPREETTFASQMDIPFPRLLWVPSVDDSSCIKVRSQPPESILPIYSNQYSLKKRVLSLKARSFRKWGCY